MLLLPLPNTMTEKKSNIKRYKDGECTCEDVMADFDQMRKMDTMRPQCMALKQDRPRPKSRTYFEARCPKSFGGESHCPKDAKVNWHCLKCHKQVGSLIKLNRRGTIIDQKYFCYSRSSMALMAICIAIVAPSV